jgi:cytoskeletal protein CcmA (bactofilin family)
MEDLTMGFFQDLKQDLSQTVNDLGNENVTKDNAEESFNEASGYESLDVDVAALLDEIDKLDNISPVDNVEVAVTTEDVEGEAGPEPEPVVEAKEDEETDVQNANDEVQDIRVEGEKEMEELLKEVELNIEEPESIEEPEVKVNSEEIVEQAISSDTAIITDGMTITGDITSSGNMDLIGNVTGNIEILGKLNITGTVTGNSSAAEIYAESAQINGEVRSKGSVKIGQSSVIIGDIFATSAIIAGAVKGDIDVHGPVILDTSAIVMGNIKSKSVQINNGAVIEGMCSQCYAEVSPSTFFNDMKKNRNRG